MPIKIRFTELFLIPFLLTSCGTSEDSRYRDTSMLERPPRLVINKSPESQALMDESAIPKKVDPGLGEDVYLTEDTPPQLKIKHPLDKAWNELIQAIKLNEIKVTDHERDKGHIYVSYDSSGFFDRLTSFSKDGKKIPIYLLTVEEKDDETTISSSMASSNEQSSSFGNQDAAAEKPADASEELLETLYKTIRDDLVEE